MYLEKLYNFLCFLYPSYFSFSEASLKPLILPANYSSSNIIRSAFFTLTKLAQAILYLQNTIENHYILLYSVLSSAWSANFLICSNSSGRIINGSFQHLRNIGTVINITRIIIVWNTNCPLAASYVKLPRINPIQAQFLETLMDLRKYISQLYNDENLKLFWGFIMLPVR